MGLLIAGPPGAGKSTLVRALAEQEWLRPALCYLERPEGNPFMRTGARNYTKRQDWFIEQYARFLDIASHRETLILDQDPRLVVLVYSKFFAEIGLIRSAQYQAQVTQVLGVMRKLRSRARVWNVVWLCAPSQVLMGRLRDRQATLPMHQEALGDLFHRFATLAQLLGRVHREQWYQFDTRVPVSEIVVALKKQLAR